MGNMDNKVGLLAFPSNTPTLLQDCSKQLHMDLEDPSLTAGLFGKSLLDRVCIAFKWWKQ